jgi:hypothetical protein
LSGYDADRQVGTVAKAAARFRDQACKHY